MPLAVRKHTALALAAFALAAMAFSADAFAQAYEPNDSFAQASGPLEGGTDYTAKVETSNDLDYYYFNTSGQRQLDIAVTAISGCGDSGVPPYFKLLDFEGDQLDSTVIYNGSSGNNTRHILWSAPYATQFVLATNYSVSTGCQYRFRIDPPSSVTTGSPGVAVDVAASRNPDDVQQVTLNGQPVARIEGGQAQRVVLGELPGDARIGLDAINSAGRWSWDFTITNLVGRFETTLLQETQGGGSSRHPRVGTVRHVVLTPLGSILETCGEVVAPLPCFPVVRGGAVTLTRRGRRYSGKVSSRGVSCVEGRKVVLRKRGAGKRTFGSATTSSTGRFAIRPRRRLRGRVYAVVAPFATQAESCTSLRSALVRG